MCMALGWSTTYAAFMVDAAVKGVAFTGTNGPWVKFHIGDPGAAGTANPAANTTRHQGAFGSNASGNSANTGALTWSAGEVTTTEDYSHFSLWTLSSGGVFIGSGLVTATSAQAGTAFTVAIGAFVIGLTVAA